MRIRGATGSRRSAHQDDRCRSVPRLWREGRLPVDELVSTTMPLERINEALDTQAEGKAIRQIMLFD